MKPSFIDKVYEYVIANLDNDKFSVSDIALFVGLSKSQTLRKVKAASGKSVNQFINEVSLTEAAKLIIETELTAAEIAYKVGYSSPSYFNKVFNKHFGITPGDFKIQNKSLSELKYEQKAYVINRKNGFYFIAAILLLIFGYVFINYKSSKIGAHQKSIAILPFKNLGPEDYQWFCDGIVDNTLSSLSTIKGLTVKSRTSSNTYRDTDKKIPSIAKELDVSFIIEGSVTVYNNKAKILIQLISANDEHLWTKDFIEDFEDIFVIQQNIAKEIAKRLEIVLNPETEKRMVYQPTENIEAFKLFQKGKIFADDRSKVSLEQSIEYYLRAVQLDSGFAEAFAEIANSYYLMGTYQHLNGQESKKLATQYVEKAFKIDSNTVRALTVKAMLLLDKREMKEAKALFECALMLNPNDATTHHHFGTFYNYYPNYDKEKRLEHFNIAQQLDPLSIPINVSKIDALIQNDKVKEADAELKMKAFMLPEDKIKRLTNQIVLKRAELISLQNQNWMEEINFFKDSLKVGIPSAFLYAHLGRAYDEILNDNINSIKYIRKAYQIDSMHPILNEYYYYSLLENHYYKEAKNLLESNSFKNIITAEYTNSNLWFNYYYYLGEFDKCYDYLEKGSNFNRLLYYAQLGNREIIYKIFADYVIDDTSKAFVNAILKERDSMYHYLDKKDIDYRLVNSRFEFDPYRKEERFKAFLKKNYLPLTHLNE